MAAGPGGGRLPLGARMRVTVAQLASVADKEAVLDRIAGVVEAADTDLVVFPEGVMHDFRPRVDLSPVAEPLEGPFVTQLREIAARFERSLVAGFWETSSDQRIHNTVVTIDARGELVGAYRKIHLFDSFGFRESERVIPGPVDPCVVALEGLRLGIMTCYDLRFPELARALTARGAQALIVPAGWVAGEHKLDHWRTLLRARAIENTVFVVAAGLSQPWYTGHSTVIDPMGLVLVELGVEPGVAAVEIDEGRLAEVREILPSISHRRM